jgi:drug/metabolite transporter (DMT)-like permease
MVFLLPLLAWHGPRLVRNINYKLYGLRCGITLFSMAAWFYAVSMMPVAELTAIQFLAPIFTTIGAALFLGETVRIRRWSATVVGFIGALVILHPDSAGLGPGTLVALFSTLLSGITTLLVKQLTNQDHPDRVVFLSFALMTPFSLVPALLVWTWPPAYVWGVFLALGLVGTIGHLMLVRAFAAADASLVMALDFSKLPFAALFGYLLFGELSTVWTWAGATLIFASSLYILHREAKLRRERKALSPGPGPSGRL